MFESIGYAVMYTCMALACLIVTIESTASILELFGFTRPNWPDLVVAKLVRILVYCGYTAFATFICLLFVR